MKNKLKIIISVVLLLLLSITIVIIIANIIHKQKINEVENEIKVVLDSNFAKMKSKMQEEMDSKGISGKLEYKITNIKKSRSAYGTEYVVSLLLAYQGDEDVSFSPDDLVLRYSTEDYFTKSGLRVSFRSPKTHELQITLIRNDFIKVPKSEEEHEEDIKEYIEKNNNKYECKVCDRKFTDDTNKKYIRMTNMCRNCYRNYCYATGKTPANYD